MTGSSFEWTSAERVERELTTLIRRALRHQMVHQLLATWSEEM
jgi:hypothetical protein